MGSRKAGKKSRLGQGESALLCSLEQGATRQHFLHAQIFLGAPEMLPFFINVLRAVPDDAGKWRVRMAPLRSVQ